jgi:segregation and condensation protein B
MNLESKIEGLLFYKAEDITKKKLCELLNVEEKEIEEALEKLEQPLINRGIVLIKKDDSVMLGVSKELSSLIESIRKDEITKELSKASLETISIILYKDGVSRSEIDYIRGVNSSFILRNLLIRGLVEKKNDPKDSRRAIYYPTFEMLSYMGASSLNDLPNYEDIKKQLEEVIKGDNIQEENDI